MTHLLLSKRWTILPFILVLVISACQTVKESPAPDTQESSETPTVSQESSETPPGTQESGEVMMQADVVFGPGTFTFPETNAGLADLSSYKATLTLSFAGTVAGQPKQWSKTYVMLSTEEPAARQLTIENAGDISDLDALFLAEAHGAAYERRGGNACNANVIVKENSQIERLHPVEFLTGVIGAEEAAAETVNDVAADYYTFDERAFGQLDVAQSMGEMWIATDGGYIIKYLVSTKGGADYFGEGIEGTLTWDYELTDVNQTVKIELPADCPAGMPDAPLLADATNIVNMPSILAYDTPTSLTDTITFYQEQIPGLGWTPLGEPTVNDTAVVLTYMRDDQTMTIIVTMGDATAVNIMLNKSQE
jgi:hypothetical protein